MASRIRVLSDDTINKIAAGEVIENPASVVKELVENSIDAGATEIVVDIIEGGRQMMRITDNGCGMSHDDALLCLERHATSKLKCIEDIHALDTMGFRGEALPSIASISKFTLLTRPSEDAAECGTMVSVDGGKVVNCSTVACAKGTSIEVKSLFFNVPVRKKFQKSPATDVAEIQRMLTLLALGHPHIKFQLISNRETLLLAQVPTVASFQELLAERIKYVLGHELWQHLLPLDYSEDNYSLKGFVGRPEGAKHNRTGQYLFINKRGVQSPLVSYAMRDAYGTMLPTGKHPVYVLHLEMDGQCVDVNVHPQKREVRLRQEFLLKSVLMKAVEKALQYKNHSWLSPHTDMPAQVTMPHVPTKTDNEESPKYNFAAKTDTFADKLWQTSQYTAEELSFVLPVLNSANSHIAPSTYADLPTNFIEPQAQPLVQGNLLFAEQDRKPAFKVVATIFHYFVAQAYQKSVPCLYFFDQAAVHTRITYEKLLQEETQGQMSQSLLIPHTLHLSPVEATFLQQQLAFLHSLGIQIKEFGNHTFVVDALPLSFGTLDIKKFIEEMLEELQSCTSSHLCSKEHKKRIALAATRAAVDKSRCLSLPEAQSLVDQLVLCDISEICPFGKKTFVPCTPQQIGALFR